MSATRILARSVVNRSGQIAFPRAFRQLCCPAMRPQILFPLFAEVSTLKGVGPKVLPLVQKLAGGLVRDLLFLSPSGLIVRRPMTATNAVEGQVGIFEVAVDR